MGKNKGNDKEIYREKPYTPKFQRHLDEEYNSFIKELRKFPKEPSDRILDFLISKFGSGLAEEEKNTELKIIVFCRSDDLREKLIALGNRGANIRVISDALKQPDIPKYLLNGHPIGLRLYNAELSPVWNEKIEEYNRKRRTFGRKAGILKAHIKHITSLEPIAEPLAKVKKDLALVNAKLRSAQDGLKEFEKVADLYLAIKEKVLGYPRKWGLPIDKLLGEKFQPVTQKSHHIFDEQIVALVDELKRIFSHRQAYIETANLLNLAFPHLYEDKDPDLVRQRYTYHQKTRF